MENIPQFESLENHKITREEMVEGLKLEREKTGFRHPGDLSLDSPAVLAHTKWIKDSDADAVNFSESELARLNLSKTMSEFDAGFDDIDFLDELANEYLSHDLREAKRSKKAPGMDLVIKEIQDAISLVKSKLKEARKKS